jgi:hypothetical protein
MGKSRCGTANRACLSWGKKPLTVSPIFFLCFNKQKIEHQPESNYVTSWTPNLWKASLHPALLNPVPGSVCLDKSSTPFLHTGQFQSCLGKPTDPTGKQHTPHVTPLSTTHEHNPVQPIGRLNPATNKTEKHD